MWILCQSPVFIISFLALGSKHGWNHKKIKYGKDLINQLVQLTHSEIDWLLPGFTAAEQNLDLKYVDSHVNDFWVFLLNFPVLPTSHYT